MGTYENKLLLETHETNPALYLDGSGFGYGRGTKNGELVVQPVNGYVSARQGRRFGAITVPTTAAAGVAGHPAPVLFEGVKPFLYFNNNYAAATKKQCELARLRLQYTAIGAGGTLPRYHMELEPAGTNRYTSGGTQITPAGVNSDVSDLSSVVLFHGAVVAPVASANVRRIQTGQIRPVIPVIFDDVTFVFGDQPAVAPSILSGTAVASQVIKVPPVIVGPQASFLLHLWRVSQSGADSLEVTMEWDER